MNQHIKTTLQIVKVLGFFFFLYFALKAIYSLYF